jgi:hypothetical protein
MASKVRISKMQGVGILPEDGQIGWLSYSAATRGGTIFIRSTSDTTALYISTNRAQYVSFSDMVDPDSDTVRFERARGIDPGIEINKPLRVQNLVPGLEFETETYGSTGTGAITTQAAGTALGVDASGYIIEKQGSGAGSTQLFTLVANHVSARATIEVRYTP